MAKVKKLKSGKWHTQVYLGTVDGKRIIKSVTANTKAECEYKASELKMFKDREDSITVRQAVESYIGSIENVASPSSIRGYKMTLKHGFPDLMNMKVKDLNDFIVQTAINQESKRISQYGKPLAPKTVISRYGLIETSLRRVCNKTFSVKLPQVIVKIKEFPLPEEIIKAVRGTDIELPCLLAMWLSLSMSEIRGLDCSSVRNGVLHIEQVRIEGEYGTVLKKTGKVSSRIRNHRLPPFLLEMIQDTATYKNFAETGENQSLLPMTRNEIYKHWKKICKAHNWSMTFHDLRAVSASVMLLLGIPDKYALQRGGWSSDHIYKTVYQQTFDAERKLVDERINAYFEQFL